VTAGGPFIEVSDLRKVFAGRGHDVVAVDGVSLSLDRSESLALVGESGSGKTTVARVIVGLERASSGRIVIDGVERSVGRVALRERRARARQVQMVFQDPYSSLDPRQRSRDAIGEVLTLHFRLSGSARAKRVAELLERVGLDERVGGALPQDLSGGQRQRVVIARALAAEPTVLILDEAVAALDVSVQAQVLNLLAEIRADSSIAYLFVSHDLAVVRQVAERAIVMQAGRIVEEGPTESLLDSPQHPYTVALRASVPRRGWRPQRRTSAAPPADVEAVA